LLSPTNMQPWSSEQAGKAIRWISHYLQAWEAVGLLS
jgi:hypothetical protein